MEERSGPSSLVIVGQVRRPVGLRGEVVVGPTGNDPSRFSPGRRLLTQSDPPRELWIRESRSYRGAVAVQFREVDSIEAAEGLRGVWLCVPVEELPALPPGVFYHYQILGLEVLDASGVSLGRVDSILETGGNDVYCVREGEQEILIPAVREYVARVDLAGKRIWLAVPRTALGGNEPPI